jgi:transglutaminase-like putative cysteine protease
MNHYTSPPLDATALRADTFFLNKSHPVVIAFAEKALGMTLADSLKISPKSRAVTLFYAVRDQIRYDPYRITFDDEAYQAHAVIEAGFGWCISKAAVLAAVLRAADIPSVIGLADVVNHLTTDKLRERMGGQTTFYNHGYVGLQIDGQWHKAVPAFNIELCERFGVKPTEFDGESDALYQEFDQANRRHMEYLVDHGTWDDLPMTKIRDDMFHHYGASPMMQEARHAQTLLSNPGLGRFEDDRHSNA